jgi:hypothetical protein
MLDLNELIPDDAGWEALTEATGINARGEIVGIGARNSRMRAFLLTREPA